MTLWESIIIVTLFSIAVIVMDEIITGSSVSEQMKLTPIHTASNPPMTALKRMFENVHSAVPPIMQTAVKLTALPEVTSASRMERSRLLLTRISSMMRERM